MENPRRNLKRKLEVDLTEDQTCPKVQHLAPQQPHSNISAKILQLVSLLNSAFSPSASDCAILSSAVHVLAVHAENEDLVDTVVTCGAVPALVRHLRVQDAVKDDSDAPYAVKDDGDGVTKPYQLEVVKGCALVLELLAIQREFQQIIVDAGALPCLVDLLRRHKTSTVSQSHIDLLRRVSGAITSLAHENSDIKTLVRMEGGIPPLVELLEYNDIKVQRAAARALRTLAFQNEGNKNQIVECNALPTLVLMLRSEDPKIHYEAVGTIGNLVHSSPNIKKEVLLAGALQPVISSLSSSCSESRREAALLVGQFASTDADYKVHIAQRGAIPPLLDMLKSSDAELREMSSFALGRLAQDSHNQAGIAHNGGIEPLLKLLESNIVPLQQNAAFALYGLADNEDNVAYIIRAGGFQKLKSGNFRIQQTRECAAKTLTRLEEKIQGRVLKHLIYLMNFAEEGIQRRVAIALAHLCSPNDRKTIFIGNNGLKLLLDIVKSPNLKQKGDASVALHKLASRASSSVSLFDIAPPSPTPQIYMGEEYVNKPKHSDVTFVVEGRSFYARRDCLLSSDIFRAMFDGSYREREAKNIVIPDIKWDVFELMLRYIYTGSVDVNLDIAHDLLKAADQYLLDGLKRICENVIAQELSVGNVFLLYNMSVDFNATTLKHACILFMLEKFDNLSSQPWYFPLVRSLVPEIYAFFFTLLVKSHPVDSLCKYLVLVTGQQFFVSLDISRRHLDRVYYMGIRETPIYQIFAYLLEKMWSLGEVRTQYRAMPLATCELIWVKQLIQELKFADVQSMKLYCDNQVALHIVSNPVFQRESNILRLIVTLYGKVAYIYGIFRMEGGIPPLVELLEFNDINVWRSAARKSCTSLI
ncbi:Arm repeat protein with ABF2, partial [Mucuna pruriens]